MKHLLKGIIERYGYVMMTKKRQQKLEEGPLIPNLDFHYLIKKIINPKENICCFDIGANEGQTAKKLNYYFPGSTIYAFEPIKNTFELLVKNVEGITGIKPYNEAMGDKPAEIKVFHRTNSEWNSLVKELNHEAMVEGANSEIVKVNSVDHFVQEMRIKKIDILKSDTEGFELAVLEGAKASLSKEIIDMVYIEVGFIKEDKQHTYWMDIVNCLERYSYSFCGLFESSYGLNLKVYYANALFMSSKRLLINEQKNNGF